MQKEHQRLHLIYLDGIRALAAIYVVFYHALRSFNSHALPKIVHPIRDVFVFGHEAVDFFIVLSGFCLMLPVLKTGSLPGGAASFFKRRARRILPTYYAALAFSILGNWLVLHELPSLHSVVTHALLIHEAMRPDFGQINAAFWSIAVEVYIYLLFPLLIAAWNRFGPIRTTVGAILTGYLLYILLTPTPIYTGFNGTSTWYLGLFALGMLGAEIAFGKLQSAYGGFRWGTAAIGLGAVGAIITRFTPFHGHSLYPGSDLLVGAAAACLMVYASQPSAVTRFLSSRPLAFIGTFSYSIYLIHVPLLQACQFWLIPRLHDSLVQTLAVYWLVVTPAIVAVAYLFHLVFERPFMSKGRITERQAEILAVTSPAP